MTTADRFKDIVAGTLICWLVLGPSYVLENVVPSCSVFSIFRIFLPYFELCGARAKKTKGKAHIRTSTCLCPLPLGRRNSSDLITSAFASVGEQAVQRAAPVSSLAVPPQAVRTADAVDLSSRDAILPDPGPAAASAADAATSTCGGFLPDSRRLLIYSCISGSAAAAAVQ